MEEYPGSAGAAMDLVCRQIDRRVNDACLQHRGPAVRNPDCRRDPPGIQPELTFGLPVPWASILQPGAQVAALAFLSVTIQHWVSLRWRSFSVAIGVGIVAMVIGYVAAMTTFRIPDWPQYFPWALPMLVLSKHPQDATAALWVSAALGFVIAAAGCLDFCRREVS